MSALAAAAFGVGFTSAYFSRTSDATITISTAESFVTVTASVDIKPESLQKKSEGQPVVAFVTLSGAVFEDVDPGSIQLCVEGGGCVPVGDLHRHDGDNVFRARFERAAVIALVQGITPPANLTFNVSGTAKGTTWSGSDGVRLVDPSNEPEEGEPSPSPSPEPSPSPDPSTSPSPSLDPLPSPSPSRSASPSA